MKTLNDLVADYGWDNFNSMTKYPSILTYHSLGDKGGVVDTLNFDASSLSENELLYATEKIDGTNSRIVFWRDDYVIGSREDLLYAKGDRIVNNTMSIVKTVRPVAERILPYVNSHDQLVVVYGETYGKGINSGREYTKQDTTHFRVFDIVIQSNVEEILQMDRGAISSWREHDGQAFVPNSQRMELPFAKHLEFVPHTETIEAGQMPTRLVDTFEWLQRFAVTRAGIDHQGHAEGVVIRNDTRSFIRKIRFEDYEKAKKKGMF